MIASLMLVSLTSLAAPATIPYGAHELVRSNWEIVRSFQATALGSVEASIPVTVIVMDSFGDTRLLGGIRRTAGAHSRNLIIVKRSALEPALLIELVRAMKASVAKHGPNPTKQVSTYVMKERRWRRPTPAESAWVKQIITQIGVAGTKSFGKLGVQRAVESTLP
jgi:hypothetical protein